MFKKFLIWQPIIKLLKNYENGKSYELKVYKFAKTIKHFKNKVNMKFCNAMKVTFFRIFFLIQSKIVFGILYG